MRGLEPFSALLKCLTWEWSANLTYDTFSCHNRDINAYTYIKQYYQPRTESFILAHLLWVASKTHSAAQFLDAIINWLPPDSFSIEFPVSRNAFASHQLTLGPIWWWYSQLTTHSSQTHTQPRKQNSWLIKRKLPLIKHWLCIKLLAKQANIRAQTKPTRQQLWTNCGWISVSAGAQV